MICFKIGTEVTTLPKTSNFETEMSPMPGTSKSLKEAQKGGMLYGDLPCPNLFGSLKCQAN